MAEGSKLKHQIVIVEKEPYTNFLIRHGLASDYRLTFHEKSFKAVAYLESSSPDLVIQDSDLDEMGGHAFYKLVKQIPHLRKTPMLFLTRDPSTFSTKDIKGSAVEVMAKPFTVSELLLRVHGFLKLSESGSYLSNAVQVASGPLQQTRVNDLLKFCEVEALSGLLRLIRHQRIAQIFFHKGHLITISLAGTDEENALDEILEWNAGTYEIHQQLLRFEPTVEESTQPDKKATPVSPNEMKVMLELLNEFSKYVLTKNVELTRFVQGAKEIQLALIQKFPYVAHMTMNRNGSFSALENAYQLHLTSLVSWTEGLAYWLYVTFVGIEKIFKIPVTDDFFNPLSPLANSLEEIGFYEIWAHLRGHIK